MERMRHNGFELHASALDYASQAALLAEVLQSTATAPFYQPLTPWGKPMSALQTSLGEVGWITDARGYRYEPEHPLTGKAWPPMPERLLQLWDRYAKFSRPPDTCLVNLYGQGAKMGLHQDADEADLGAPVLGISLGDTALFRLGGPSRKDATLSLSLRSGDLNILAGSSRRAYHGVDRILFGSSRLIDGGGRISLTLRRARP